MKVTPHSKSSLFSKAFYSSMVGLPLSYVLNVTVLPHFAPLLLENPFLASALIAIPFFIASVFRMYSIDWVYEKYRIDISPANLFRKLYRRIKYGSVI